MSSDELGIRVIVIEGREYVRLSEAGRLVGSTARAVNTAVRAERVRHLDIPMSTPRRTVPLVDLQDLRRWALGRRRGRRATISPELLAVEV